MMVISWSPPRVGIRFHPYVLEMATGDVWGNTLSPFPEPPARFSATPPLMVPVDSTTDHHQTSSAPAPGEGSFIACSQGTIINAKISHIQAIPHASGY